MLTCFTQTNKQKKKNVETIVSLLLCMHFVWCTHKFLPYSSLITTELTAREWSLECSILIDENLVYVDHNCFLVFVNLIIICM